MSSADRPVLYAIVCGSPAARGISELVAGAQQDGWRVCVLATSAGLGFVDADALAMQSGYRVRSRYKRPGTQDLLPGPDAIVVAPATCNTVNKWAAGISDTLTLGILTETLGRPIPIVAVPYSNSAQAAHPAFRDNLDRLRSWGVHVLFGDDVCRLPSVEGAAGDPFPWQLIRRALRCHHPSARSPGGRPG